MDLHPKGIGKIKVADGGIEFVIAPSGCSELWSHFPEEGTDPPKGKELFYEGA
jgi:hypothetical protein